MRLPERVRHAEPTFDERLAVVVLSERVLLLRASNGRQVASAALPSEAQRACLCAGGWLVVSVARTDSAPPRLLGYRLPALP